MSKQHRKLRDHTRKHPRQRRKPLSKVDISQTDSPVYNSYLISKQSPEPVDMPGMSVLSSFQIAIVVVSSIFILGLVGLVLFKKKEKERNIPSILLESRSGRPQMQEGLRDSLESTRSQIPVPDYILPPSLEFESALLDSCSFKKKLSKPLSAWTLDSQESLGKYYRS